MFPLWLPLWRFLWQTPLVFCVVPEPRPPCSPTVPLIVPSLLPQFPLVAQSHRCSVLEAAARNPTDPTVPAPEKAEENVGDEGERR